MGSLNSPFPSDGSSGGSSDSQNPLLPDDAEVSEDAGELVDGLGGEFGFGENVVSRNDDGSSPLVDITSVFPDGIDFFGTTWTGIYINTNGNITFERALSSFTPNVIGENFGSPIIAPFWADVDTRAESTSFTNGGNSRGTNQVWYDLDTETNTITVTWDDVGYYSRHTDKLNAFQLQLVNTGDAGDFDIIYRYEAINWVTGDASGGTNGLGGTPARAGFAAGDGINYFEFFFSGDEAFMLNLERLLLAGSEEPGVWRFSVRDGRVVGVGQENVDDVLEGTENADIMDGRSGNDTLIGLGGDDTMVGGEGDDTLRGGDGDDDLIGGTGTNAIFGDAGDDTAVYAITRDQANIAHLGGTTYTVSGQIGGVDFSDTLNDVEHLQFEDVTLTFGVDEISNVIEGTEEGESLTGSTGNDTINGLGGDDTINAAGGDDVLDGGDGDDTLNAGDGNDRLIGGTGTNALSGEDGDDSAVFALAHTDATIIENEDGTISVSGQLGENPFADTLTGIERLSFTDFDLLFGQDDADDNLTGSANNDKMEGRGGDDTLTGGAGDDFLIGGTGTNTLMGDDGTDTAAYAAIRNSVEIADNGDGTYALTGLLGETAFSDSLSGMERLNFSDGDMTIERAIEIRETQKEVARLFSALFDRMPAEEGLRYWVNDISTSITIQGAAHAFTQSQEFIDLYGAAVSDEEFVTLLYNNILDRDPAAAGLEYWLAELAVTEDRGAVIVSFSNSEEFINNTEAEIDNYLANIALTDYIL
ncbi:DUF4214 domain-containing protein [Pseudomaricurvus alkylphenolicus]|uniref:nidogen-like domain-containing protein n=1 Tax=Pseudomaricurvus alkylphenolicus TaxID=1306991 RepID=UPI001422E70C|nr:nidogen-like domain-containing protein [Pseudomaricurvus alkylphenolicus]NIB40068.1 DUF4214 domain-containing protein [Pseudomaricurvus alkylphenolicus]